MKTFLLSLMLASSCSAFAFDAIEDECREASITKLHYKALELDADLDERTVSKLDEDKTNFGTTKLMWFKASAYRRDDKARIFVTASMEKPLLPIKKPCF